MIPKFYLSTLLIGVLAAGILLMFNVRYRITGEYAVYGWPFIYLQRNLLSGDLINEWSYSGLFFNIVINLAIIAASALIPKLILYAQNQFSV